MGSRRQRISESFFGGHNDRTDRKFLAEGELQKSKGIEYLDGDRGRAWKVKGRTTYGNANSVGKVQSLDFLAFDDGTKLLLAKGDDGVLYESALTGTGTTGSFTTLTSGLTTTDVKVVLAHNNNRWYMVDGVDRNLVITTVSSSTSIYQMGLIPPVSKLTVTAVSVGTATAWNPAAGSGGLWSDISLAFDGSTGGSPAKRTPDRDTYAYMAFERAGVPSAASQTVVFSWDQTLTNTFTSGHIELTWQLAGYRTDDSRNNSDAFSSGSDDDIDSGFDVEVRWQYTLDNGSNWNALISQRRRGPHSNKQSFQLPVGDIQIGDGSNSLLQVRCTMQYIAGSTPATTRIYDVLLHNGVSNDLVTTTGSVYYSYSEYDEITGRESPIANESSEISLNGKLGVLLVLPPAPVNSSSTHYFIYRTADDQGVGFDEGNLGRLDYIPVSQTTYTDRFVEGVDFQPTPLAEFLELDAFGEKTYLDKNTPPPNLSFIGVFQGAIFGVNGRKYHQSIAGFPESWPSVFSIDSFPFKEHDELVCGFQVNERLWLAGKRTIIILDYPIKLIQGSVDVPEPRQLSGAPGCTGVYAATQLTFEGESLIAWVSPFGVYLSNLVTIQKLTSDVDWETNVSQANLDDAVLFWRTGKQQLMLVYDSDGDGANDKFALIHMARDLRKPDGSPKITWGHDGVFTKLTSGLVGNTWREYSAKFDADGVFLEEGSDTTDASNSYNTNSDIEMDVLQRRSYNTGISLQVGRGSIYHTDPGTTVTVTRSSVFGFDSKPSDNRTDTNTMVFSGHRANDFNVLRAGEWYEFGFQHIGKARFALGPLELIVSGAEEPGETES